ncbi:hypothetical protein [Brevibacillus sp. SAFN-007a]|uniref:hypothetical protein n=1 Tax=Brevibacillus sp. SAFN-007a TaxID=3436862 RepID=UPI003F7FE113
MFGLVFIDHFLFAFSLQKTDEFGYTPFFLAAKAVIRILDRIQVKMEPAICCTDNLCAKRAMDANLTSRRSLLLCQEMETIRYAKDVRKNAHALRTS